MHQTLALSQETPKVTVGETADKVALNATGCVTSWNSECILECFPFQKLYVFLFQDILVLTRPVTRNERQAFQVYRQPIPVQELLLEDLQDGDVKMGGSFRGAFGNSDKGMDPASSSVVAVSFQLGLGQGDIFVSLLDFGIGGGGFVGISNLTDGISKYQLGSDLLFPLFISSQKHFPSPFPRSQPGPVPHAAGQRRLPQAAVGELHPHRHHPIPEEHSRLRAQGAAGAERGVGGEQPLRAQHPGPEAPVGNIRDGAG